MPRCPTPWKTPYPNPQKAHAKAHEFGQDHYPCPGGGHWHTTTPEATKAHDLAKLSRSTAGSLGKTRKGGKRWEWRRRRGKKPTGYGT